MEDAETAKGVHQEPTTSVRHAQAACVALQIQVSPFLHHILNRLGLTHLNTQLAPLRYGCCGIVPAALQGCPEECLL